MTHTITTVTHDDLPALCKFSAAIQRRFLHPYIQQTLIDMHMQGSYVNVSATSTNSVNIIVNAQRPYVISFTL